MSSVFTKSIVRILAIVLTFQAASTAFAQQQVVLSNTLELFLAGSAQLSAETLASKGIEQLSLEDRRQLVSLLILRLREDQDRLQAAQDDVARGEKIAVNLSAIGAGSAIFTVINFIGGGFATAEGHTDKNLRIQARRYKSAKIAGALAIVATVAYAANARMVRLDQEQAEDIAQDIAKQIAFAEKINANLTAAIQTQN